MAQVVESKIILASRTLGEPLQGRWQKSLMAVIKRIATFDSIER